MAKRFFYVFVGFLSIICLSDRNVRLAGAQSGFADPHIKAPNIELDAVLMFVVDRIFYVSVNPVGGPASPNPNPIPGTSHAIATGLDNTGDTQYVVLLEDGDVYGTPYEQGSGRGPWTFRGNVFGATPAIRHSWGQLKARYR